MVLYHLARLGRGFCSSFDGPKFSCEGLLFLGFLMVLRFTIDHVLGFTTDLHHFLMEDLHPRMIPSRNPLYESSLVPP